MDQAFRRLASVKSRHVMNAGLRASDDIGRWLAAAPAGWNACPRILKFVRNSMAGSRVAFSCAFRRHPLAPACDVQIAAKRIVPRPASLRCHCFRNSIHREPEAGRAEEMTYEVLLCSFLPSIIR
jgi:hypothetical protein